MIYRIDKLMIQSISSILPGIQRNVQQVEGIANRLSQPAAVPASENLTPSAPESVSDKLVAAGEPGLEEDMVSLLLAKRFIQMQAGIIRTEDEMLAELVNLGRRKASET